MADKNRNLNDSTIIVSVLNITMVTNNNRWSVWYDMGQDKIQHS
jgi:hypothetical protein